MWYKKHMSSVNTDRVKKKTTHGLVKANDNVLALLCVSEPPPALS